MTASRSIHLTTNNSISFLFMAEYYSIVYMCHIFFIHSSVDGHLGCFHVLAVVRYPFSIAWDGSHWHPPHDQMSRNPFISFELFSPGVMSKNINVIGLFKNQFSLLCAETSYSLINISPTSWRPPFYSLLLWVWVRPFQIPYMSEVMQHLSFLPCLFYVA